MNVSCPQCSTVYRVDPAKVPEGGVRARCSTCGGVIPVGIAAASSPRRTPADAMSDAFSQKRPTPGPFVPPARRPTPAQPSAPASAPMRHTPPTPQRATPAPSPRVTPAATPRVTPITPQRATPAVPSAALPPRPTPPAQMAAPPISVPAVTPPAPSSATSPTPVIPISSAAPAASTPSSAPAPQAASGRRPINPFLARDPSLRAKRLARALVSDMVAYYPAKHAEGLEKGTLKELFRDEIKKSYEEYVAQVGADFARSTTHFQESLNEVLGAGRKIF